MKKFCLIISGLLLFVNSTYAEEKSTFDKDGLLVKPEILSIRDAYNVAYLPKNKSPLKITNAEFINEIIFLDYYKGVLTGLVFGLAYDGKLGMIDTKEYKRNYDCITRDIRFYENMIFRDYEDGKISGYSSFTLTIIDEALKCIEN